MHYGKDIPIYRIRFAIVCSDADDNVNLFLATFWPLKVYFVLFLCMQLVDFVELCSTGSAV